jgi:DNA-binding PadR family transcriptional regulator
MRDLTVLEQLILAAIISLEDEAYSMAIRKKVREIANKNIMYGTLYNVMDQLLHKGYVTKAKGDQVPERRGRRRMYYKSTSKGQEALLKALDLHEAIWANLQDLVRSHRE